MPFSTGHALLIGVGTYQYVSRLNVPVTATDAQELATVLYDEKRCGYPKEQVTLLRDGTATRAGFLAALDDLAAKTTEDDTVLLFYSGHGEFGEDGAYYLTTYDMQKNDQRKVVAGSAVKEAELIDKLRAITAKRLILLFNACHSGAISPTLGEDGDDTGEGAQTLPGKTAAAILSTGEGRVIITACREGQYSFVGSGKCTIFAQALIDGLQGNGTFSKGGFVSTFDLYTSVYYAVGEAVGKIPLAWREHYAGGVQQPELTVLKGIGPMPVALYGGAAAALGDFDDPEPLDEETAVYRVDKKYSERMLRTYVSITSTINQTTRQHEQHIGDNAQVGVAVAGDVQGGITTGPTIGGHQINGDYVGGDKVAGDKVVGDKIDARGAQGFINRPTGAISQNFGTQRNVDTGGGDYSERDIDKRKGTFVSGDQNNDKRQGTFVTGDQFNMSGNFSGAILNIKSTLNNVTQSIGAAPHGDPSTKDQLKQLLEQLSAELQKAPPNAEGDAEAVAETAKAAVEQATKAKPNKTLVQISAEGLKQAAQSLAAVLPTVLPIATQIADALRKFVGG